MGRGQGAPPHRPQKKTEESADAAAKGYMSLVNHALAQSEIGVRQVGQRLQQDLRGHSSLEVRRVELVPAEI